MLMQIDHRTKFGLNVFPYSSVDGYMAACDKSTSNTDNTKTD